MRTRNFGLFSILLFAMGMAQAQTLSFRADQVVVPPSILSANRCVQVGIYLNTVGLNNVDYSQVTVNIDYVLSAGMVLSGNPVVEISDFVGTANAGFPEPGIRSPGAPIASSPCGSPDVVNVATLGTGPAADYFGDAVTPATAGNSGFANEVVNTVTNHIVASRVNGSPIFRTTDTEHLVAIISFPVDMSTPNGETISVNFTGGAGQNVINGPSGARDANGNTTDGYVAVFAPINCSGATVADNQGAGSGTNITINYLDPQAGGPGGDITFTMPHAASNPDEIMITGNDGFSTSLTGGAIGAGSTSLSIDTMADASPATGVASVTYTISYGATAPAAIGGGTIFGTPCTVTVNWAAPSCTVAFNPAPVNGGNTDLVVTLTNAFYNGMRFAQVASTATSWPGNIDLSVPSSTAGNVLTFNPAYSITGIDNNDVGTYTVQAFSGPSGATSTCNTVLTLQPPVNMTDCNATTAADIEGSIDITLAGNVGTVDFTVIYNGTTYANLPSGVFNLPNIVGDVTSYVVRANGFDMAGNPTFDEITCDINYNPPTCVASQMPAGPYDVGTAVSLFLDTTNAVSATINGNPMTPDVDPNDFFNVQWSANHIANAPTTITATVTNPDGETSTCTWTIEVNCAASIVSVGTVGSNGTVMIEGIGGVTYDIWYAASCANGPGQNLPGDAIFAGTITLSGSGIVTGSGPAGHLIEPDVCYYVTCQASDVILDRFANRTVPTLGEWGLIAFSLLLVGAGLVLMRKRRLAQ